MRCVMRLRHRSYQILMASSLREGKASSGISTHSVAVDTNDADEERPKLFNVTLGTLGHVDSR